MPKTPDELTEEILLSYFPDPEKRARVDKEDRDELRDLFASGDSEAAKSSARELLAFHEVAAQCFEPELGDHSRWESMAGGNWREVESSAFVAARKFMEDEGGVYGEALAAWRQGDDVEHDPYYPYLDTIKGGEFPSNKGERKAAISAAEENGDKEFFIRLGSKLQQSGPRIKRHLQGYIILGWCQAHEWRGQDIPPLCFFSDEALNSLFEIRFDLDPRSFAKVRKTRERHHLVSPNLLHVERVVLEDGNLSLTLYDPPRKSKRRR